MIKNNQSQAAELIGALSVTALAIWLVLVPAARADGPTLQLVPDSKKEFIDPTEQISGGSTLGVVYVGASDKVQPAALWAFFRNPTSGALKLSLNSIDGRYSGEAQFEVTAQGSGWTELPFTSQHAEFVARNYPSLEKFAGLLSNETGDEFYPLRWGQGAATDLVRIYINSERAKSFFYDAGGKLSNCRAPTNDAGFKFNTICDVPADQFETEDGVTIHRKFGVRRVDPIEVSVKTETPDRTSGGE